MRVTDASFLAQFLRGIQANREIQNQSIQDLTDGKRVRFASDDPAGARSSLAHRARLARLTGFDRAAAGGRVNLESIDAALGDAHGLLIEARSIALAGATGVLSSDDNNEARAVEIDGLRAQLLDLANLQQNNRYVFAGTATDTRPFDDAGDYFGSGDESRIPVSDARTIGVTVAGDSVFHSDENVFVILGDLAQALRDGDTAAMETAAADLTTQLGNVSTSRAEAGIRMRTLDASVDTHTDERLRLQRRISEIEDISIEEVAVSLAASSTSLEALAASAGRVLSFSLFEYLA